MAAKRFRKILLPLLCAALLALTAGCSGKVSGREITVTDGMCRTLVTVYGGETVAEVLESAEISLSDGDTVSPNADEVLDDFTDTITVSRYADVTVAEGETVTSVSLTGSTVADALTNAGITLNKNDVTNHSLSAYLTDGMEITVERWYEVTLTVAGASRIIVTDVSTVAELLEAQNIVVDEDDRVSPDAAESLSDGMEISVEYVSSAEIRDTEEIAYKTVEQETDELYIGETQIAQEGRNGTRTYIYEVIYVEGVEESRTLVESYISEEAVNEIILIGTKEEETEPETEPETTTKKETQTTKQTEQTTVEQTTTASSGKPTPTSIPEGCIYWTFSEDCDNSGNGWFTFYFEDGHEEYADYWAP